MLEYFEVSAEASAICSHVLKSINQIRTDRIFIERALQDSPNKNIDSIISELSLFVAGTKPFSAPSDCEFKAMREKCSSVLQCLKKMHKKVGKKTKVIECLQKASEICLTAAILAGPAVLGFPFKHSATKLSGHLSFSARARVLRRVRDQLDSAAKGTYILSRDFDTMSRLVARLGDALERGRAMIRTCLERRSELGFCLLVVKDIERSGLRRQVEEVEEHVYLCLVSINKARALVIKEMANTPSSDI